METESQLDTGRMIDRAVREARVEERARLARILHAHGFPPALVRDVELLDDEGVAPERCDHWACFEGKLRTPQGGTCQRCGGTGLRKSTVYP